MGSRYKVKEQVYAGHGKRFANYLIDQLLYMGAFWVLGMTLGVICEMIGDYSILFFLENVNPIVDHIITGIVFAGFYIVLEGKYQISIGKLITQTIVVDEFGEKPEMSAIVKRSFSRMIPFNALSFLSNDARGWHDSISKTYVVDKKLLAEKKMLFNDLNRIGQDDE